MENKKEDPFYIGDKAHCLSYLALALGAFLAFKFISLKEMDLWWVIIILIIAVGLITHFSNTSSKKYRKDKQAEREKDIRKRIHESINNKQIIPYFLYLRPFDTRDAIIMGDYNPDSEINNPDFQAANRSENLEIYLGRAVQPDTFLAVGRPGAIGASKMETDNKIWKQEALLLARHAKGILMLPASRKGTLWEVDQVFSNAKLLAKTIFIMPPKLKFLIGMSKEIKFKIPEEWEKVRKLLSRRGVDFPPFSEKGLLFTMYKNGKVKKKIQVNDWSIINELQQDIKLLTEVA